MTKINNPVFYGVPITLIGCSLYVLMGILLKVLRNDLLLNQIMFLQCFGGFLCACYLIRMKKYCWQEILAAHTPIQLVRVAMSLGASYTLTYGLHFVSLFDALVIVNASPLVIPWMRQWILKKARHAYLIPAVLVAFLGLIFLLAPDHHLFEGPICIIFISMFCSTFSLLALESMQPADPNLSIFYYFSYSSLVTAAVMVTQHQLAVIPFDLLAEGILVGILFFIVQSSILYAAKYISSQLISILFYAEIILSLLFSLAFENLPLSYHLFIGTLFILLGGTWVAYLEHKR